MDIPRPCDGKDTTTLRTELTKVYDIFTENYAKSDISIIHREETDEANILYGISSLPTAKCPYCEAICSRTHSTYVRTLQDLTVFEKRTILKLQVRKFFCDNEKCGTKIFTEQPGNEIFRSRRRTRRCELSLYRTGINLSSVQASTNLWHSGVHVSHDTVLRDKHRLVVPKRPDVQRIGVDDWAYRKGCTYGSVIVDLDTKEIISVYKGRDTESFKRWLDDHPNVFEISRDRSSDYSKAIQLTGRGITEVADRFHLVKNSVDVLTSVVSSNYADYRRLVRPDLPDAQAQDKDKSHVIYKEVKSLKEKGLSIEEIGKRLDIAFVTADKYASADRCPERIRTPQLPYHEYDTLVESEYRSGKLLKDIYHKAREQGFPGSLSSFYRRYRHLEDIGRDGNEPEKQSVNRKLEPIMPIRQIVNITFNKIRGKEITAYESDLINRLMRLKWYSEVYLAIESFYWIIKGDNPQSITTWTNKYLSTSVKQLSTFVRGISKDLTAVINSIEYNVSNGITEGYVNKIKVMKRIMYGRASCELINKTLYGARLFFTKIA